MTFRDKSADVTLDNANEGIMRTKYARSDPRNPDPKGDFARRASLEAEIDALKAKVASRENNKNALADIALKLKAENERLRADAERINALEQKGLEIRIQFDREKEDIFLVYKIRGFPNDLEFIEIGCGVTVREAIDAATKDFSTSQKEEECDK